MRIVYLLLAGLILTAQSPYAGDAHHDIKALSPHDIADLRAGRGMGLAKPAELNGYPGPMHVLELARELDLSVEQHARSEEVMTRMRKQAAALGEQIIASERDLDRAFAAGAIDPAQLEERVAKIAALTGALRATHLHAHLDQRAVLTADQARDYARLRGYAAPKHPRN